MKIKDIVDPKAAEARTLGMWRVRQQATELVVSELALLAGAPHAAVAAWMNALGEMNSDHEIASASAALVQALRTPKPAAKTPRPVGAGSGGRRVR